MLGVQGGPAGPSPYVEEKRDEGATRETINTNVVEHILDVI